MAENRPQRDGVGASRVVCPPGPWSSVHAFLCERFPFISPQTWLARMEEGLVLDDTGLRLGDQSPYKVGQVVHYFREVTLEKRLPYEATILYQDDHLVVVDKPHFLPVIPSGGYVQETVLVRLKRLLDMPDLSPLHRIDRDTAGLVLFSLQTRERAAYQALFRNGLIDKRYQAIAPYSAALAAQPKPLHISNRLETAANFMQMHAVSGAPNARTDVLAIERLHDDSDFAAYTLHPKTGQRHQLRVHMLGLGVPIVGDEIYPHLMPERDISTGNHAPLQLLAQSLRFVDPITGQQRQFESRRTLCL